MRISISVIFRNDNCWYSPQCQLTLCMLGNVYVFVVCFFGVFFLSSFSFVFRIQPDDPDQAQHSVGPDLGPDCLQMLSADDPSG